MYLMLLTSWLLVIMTQLVLSVDDCGRTPIPPVQGRIIGGSPALPFSYPWQISLCLKVEGDCFHLCGASVVAKKWAITAAHCVRAFHKAEYWGVKAGIFFANATGHAPGEQLVDVDAIFIHQSYRYPFSRSNDLALIRLKSDLRFTDRVQPVCLPKRDEDVYKLPNKAVVTGWGLTIAGDPASASLVLRQVTVPFVEFDACVRAYEPVVNGDIGMSMLCAGSPGKDACQMDSGGPLVRRLEKGGRWFQYGVVSFGAGCGNPEAPGRQYSTDVSEWTKTFANIQGCTIEYRRNANGLTGLLELQRAYDTCIRFKANGLIPVQIVSWLLLYITYAFAFLANMRIVIQNNHHKYLEAIHL